MAQVQGFTLSATTALAPPNARKAFSKGLEKARKSQWNDAEKEFARAVELYPKFAAAWYQLGLAQAAQNFKDSRHSFEQAIAADPRYVNPYQALARLAFESKQWLEAVDFSGRLLALNPVNFPDVWLYNAAGNYFLSDFSAAETSARAGLQADPSILFPGWSTFSAWRWRLGVRTRKRHSTCGSTSPMPVIPRMPQKAKPSCSRSSSFGPSPPRRSHRIKGYVLGFVG
jgi:tetratricopeptide (TPR) repeat protein